MYGKAILLSIFIGTLSYSANAQPRTDAFLKDLLSDNNNNPIIKEVLQHPAAYRPQIIYTKIDRDKNNKPTFTNYYYNVDSLLYFNPASTVKLPLALLSLEKLNDLRAPGVDKYTYMQFDSGYNKLRPEYSDSTAPNGLPSIAHFIRKAFLVSDNDAYNRMYEWTGQQTINRELREKGYGDARITRHFYPMTADQNRHSSQIRFIKKGGTVLYTQAPACNTDSFDFSHINKIGNGYLNSKDSLVNEPMDFTTHNNVSLYDYQQILQSALYYDSYVKFFFRDSLHRKLPEGVRVFNKVGWAYGFLTDISYVADLKNHIEYMLTATLYANSDGILNDDKYDFDTIAHPFMYAIGQTIYQYERSRPRKYTPDLSAFKITYEKRIPDQRPVIKEVDN